jgi:UDP-glucuronate decarboxylase
MPRYDRLRVLVTGGAGFPGSHLCAHLLKEDCQVVCVDNFSTGTRENVIDLLSRV